MKPEIAATLIHDNVSDQPVGLSLTAPQVEERYPDIKRTILSQEINRVLTNMKCFDVTERVPDENPNGKAKYVYTRNALPGEICHGCRYDSEAPSNQKLSRFCTLREKYSTE